mmetsp:Transcript_6062/g.12387  ORF Transcript_6062/g.12387 Transcript_6062/m.12387 type:complete len:178 (+) Transcript_6062:100-633(+)
MNERVAKSVAFLLRNPNASVSEAMAAVQVFSREECANRSLQQRYHGFNGHLLKALLRKKKEVKMVLVTVPHTEERVEALAKASTHGAVFAVTGGDHFTSDDMFKAAELPAKKAKIEQLKKNKKERLAGIEREAVGRKILEQGKEIKALTGNELTALLKCMVLQRAEISKCQRRGRCG